MPLESDIIFTRSTIATFVNSNVLIEIAGVNVPRYDHDPVTLAPKALMTEETLTNSVKEFENLADDIRAKARVTVTVSTNFPLLVSGDIFLITGNGLVGDKYIYQSFPSFPSSATIRTFFVYLRRNTGIFAHLIGGNNNNSFANFNLETGIVGSRGSAVSSSTMHLWKDG